MLVIHNPGLFPLGQFDALDGYLTSFKGGEVATLVAVTAAQGGGTDTAAADIALDGYVGTSSKTRPAVTLAMPATLVPPYFLTDDGTSGYGTILGSVVGGTAGQNSTGTVVGPSTAIGSGKCTLWASPGVYGVTLDAVDTSATGLVPTNSSVTVNKALGYTSAGLLTVSGSSLDFTGGTVKVGTVLSFETTGGLVQTPVSLTQAVNSPSGPVANTQAMKFTQLVFYWYGSSAL